MKTKAILLGQILILLSLFIAAARADVLYLKNGRKIEGLVKNEDKNCVELEVAAGTVKFQKEEVEKIELVTPKGAEIIRQKWDRQKQEFQEKIAEQKYQEERLPKKIEFLNNGHNMVINVTLNKKVEASLVLDTGASVITIRRSIAEKLGIDLDKVKPDAKVRLADGRQVDAKYILLKSVKVQNVEAENVETIVLLDEKGDLGGDGLLGMSFLKRFNFKIDQKEKKLVLEKL